MCFQILALIAVTIAVGILGKDVFDSQTQYGFSRQSLHLSMTQLGQIWFDLAPASLQLTQAVIERYIDPCGLIRQLNCEPFLWHPMISTLLQWPAVFVFLGLATLFVGLVRLCPKSRNRTRRFGKR